MRLSQPSAGSGAPRLSTSASASPLSLSATARLAPTNPPPMITTSKFMQAIIAWRQVSFIIAPLAEIPLAKKQDAHRPLPVKKQPDRCPHGGGERSPFPPACEAT